MKKRFLHLFSLMLTVLLLILVEGMFLYSCSRNYYNSVQQTMYRRFSSVNGQLKMYTGDTAQKAAANRSVALRRMVEQFSDKDKYEFMLLDSYGGVIASSSGTDAEGILSSADFERAQENADGMGMAIYRTASNEMVMAVCCLVPYAAEDVAAMRLVTSLTLIQNQLKSVFLISIVVMVVILGFTVASGLYFVRSIVVPLGQVERTAASIARGELDVRLPVTGDSRDEVDRLRGTINQMAEGLEETEKMKNEFISSVSHELRTPLASIRSLADALNDGMVQDEKDRKRYYGYILREHLYGTNLDLKRLTVQQLRPIALSYLKPKRMPHVLGTEQEAVRLAERYGADVTKARIAALLHDCTKKLDMDEQLALCRHYGIPLDELEQKALKLLHSKTGAAIAREIADITVASEDLFALVTLRKLSQALMERIHGSYRFIVGFNLTLIALGVAGVLPPATSALLHNGSTLGISLRNMTDLLDDEENTQK